MIRDFVSQVQLVVVNLLSNRGSFAHLIKIGWFWVLYRIRALVAQIHHALHADHWCVEGHFYF